MTDPMTPLTDESEALLAEVHGTQMALTVFPARLRAIEDAAARRAVEARAALTPERLAKALSKVFACGEVSTVDGSVGLDTVASMLLAALATDDAPRERCAVCGVGRWVIAHDPEAGPSYHPFAAGAR